ncbi:MAG: CoA-binding protein [Proteobacteria bacterium]|nr:CoA-binding protein [Pseudomonadota bacterium]
MDELLNLIKESKNIAIVGISNDPEKPSYRVAEYLKNNGFRIIPINPKYDTVLGERCYKSLTEVEENIDIIDVFRRSEDIPEIVEEALKKRPKIFWMQLGIENSEAKKMLEQNGIYVVQNLCLKIFHSSNREKLL